MRADFRWQDVFADAALHCTHPVRRIRSPFFPGIILYLTFWYPSGMRARIIALFMPGIAIAGILGGPLSGWIMNNLAGVNGWKGWQWMFLLAGLPAVALGILVLFILDNSMRYKLAVYPGKKS